MKIYISGPMTGYPDMNFPAFNDAAKRLRELGHEVVNPAELNPDPGAPWKECMKADIKALVDCDHVILLEGWRFSKGARIEERIAQELEIDTTEIEEWPQIHKLSKRNQPEHEALHSTN